MNFNEIDHCFLHLRYSMFLVVYTGIAFENFMKPYGVNSMQMFSFLFMPSCIVYIFTDNPKFSIPLVSSSLRTPIFFYLHDSIFGLS